MRGRPRAVPDPGGILVALAGRADHGGIDERALAHASALGLKIARDRLKQVAVETVREKLAPEAHEGGALGRRLGAGKTAKAPEARPVGGSLDQRHVGKIVPG